MDICRFTNAQNLGKSILSKAAGKVSIAITAMIFSISALAQNPIPMVTAPLVPGQKNPASPAFTLTVNGNGFVSGATVNWNGNARTTTFFSSKQLTASINAADVATASTASVTVVNPAPGGGRSNVAYFQVAKTSTTAGFAKLDYSTDVSPQDVTTADFNGDGKLDLAVPTGNNTISILLGNGTGTFPTHTEYGVPGHPIAIATGDFNNDGKIDLVTVAGFLNQVSVLLGNGDGTFQAHAEYATGSHPSSVAVADVNGDGKLDLIVTDQNDNKVAVLLGNGDGTFQAHVDYASGNAPAGVAVGDFNGDGKLDLAIAANTDSMVSILFGNGDGTFQGPISFPTALNCNSVVTGDFNGDGKLDLAVGTSNKALSVLLGNGDGTFQNHRDYAVGSNSVLVAAADLNADSHLDLIVANANDNTVSVLLGNPDGTFKGQSVFPTSAIVSGLTIGDFNNNGKLDIAVAASTANTVSDLDRQRHHAHSECARLREADVGILQSSQVGHAEEHWQHGLYARHNFLRRYRCGRFLADEHLCSLDRPQRILHDLGSLHTHSLRNCECRDAYHGIERKRTGNSDDRKWKHSDYPEPAQFCLRKLSADRNDFTATCLHIHQYERCTDHVQLD